MPSVTTKGFPFPLSTDVPAGHTQMQSLAQAADDHVPLMGSIKASALLNVSTATLADVPGCTVTVTTKRANAVAIVVASFDLTCSTAGQTFTGKLTMDGVVQPSGALSRLVTPAARNTIVGTWAVVLAAAGNHTLKLQASLDSATGTAVVNAAGTAMTYLVQEQ